MKIKKSLVSQMFGFILWPIGRWHRLAKWTNGRWRCHLVHQFGQARLVRLPNGQHELIGGTDADRAAAFEWSSLFAHEIVFPHFHREAKPVVGRVTRRPLLWKWWPMRHAL